MSTGMGRILGHARRLSRYSRRASTFSSTGSRSFSARPTIHSKLDSLNVEMGNMLNVQKEFVEKMNMLVDSKIQLVLEIQKMLYLQRELWEKLHLHSESPGQIQLLFEKANEPKHPINKVKDSPAWSVITMSISVLALATFLDLEGKITKFIDEKKEKSAIGEGTTHKDHADVSNQSANGEDTTHKDHADVSNQSANGEDMTRKDQADVSNQD